MPAVFWRPKGALLHKGSLQRACQTAKPSRAVPRRVSRRSLAGFVYFLCVNCVQVAWLRVYSGRALTPEAL